MSRPAELGHCEQQELAVGWALHALEPADEAVFRAHLPGCGRCQATVRETEELGAVLALGVPQVQPPEVLGERIRELASEARSGPLRTFSLRRRSRRTTARWPLLAAAAVLVLAAMSVSLGLRAVQLDAERDLAAQRVAELSEVLELAADPATRTIELTGPEGRLLARLLVGPDSRVLLPLALPANRIDDQTYVLWGLRPGDAVPLRTFDVSPEPSAVQPVGPDATADSFVGYAVSLEPGRTMPPAPSNVLASGQVDS
jgi:Anti-sigma-K factor rskA, C-terminal